MILDLQHHLQTGKRIVDLNSIFKVHEMKMFEIKVIIFDDFNNYMKKCSMKRNFQNLLKHPIIHDGLFGQKLF